jgi:hypothetical protein
VIKRKNAGEILELIGFAGGPSSSTIWPIDSRNAREPTISTIHHNTVHMHSKRGSSRARFSRCIHIYIVKII